ncbi:ribosomal protein S18-alanine N-acetyltransferase [bacterium]|nr:ribosomal protein S18-alanine N-acetyltransferase [bacterium]
MTKEDLDEVTVIDSEVYGDHHWSKKSFFDELSNDLARYYSLINSDGKLVAYAGTWHILEECHITNIAVSPLHRRKKYGEVLLKQIIDDCYSEKIKYITLEVRVSNSAAINLYSKYGFTSFGTRKAYYQDNNEDALIMWTKNIFYEEYKSNYEKITQKLNEGIIVK